ncbi:transcriptional repressor, partial [Streptomyces olivaceus]
MTAPRNSRTPATAAELRQAGLRATAARVALLQTVREGNHLDAEALAAGVRERVGQVSHQAGYDAQHAHTPAPRVRRIEPPRR